MSLDNCNMSKYNFLIAKACQPFDTLSLEKAMQIAFRNSNISSSNQKTAAELETKLLTDICSKYYTLLFYNKCFHSVNRTRQFVINKLIVMENNAPDISEHKLYVQSILADLDLQLFNYQSDIKKSKTDLFGLLGIKGKVNYYLSDRFEPAHKCSLSVSDNAITQLETNKSKQLYNIQLLLLQQVNTKKQLAEHKIKGLFENFKYDYPELKNTIHRYISVQIDYLEKLLEIKKLHIAIAKDAAKQTEIKAG